MHNSCATRGINWYGATPTVVCPRGDEPRLVQVGQQRSVLLRRLGHRRHQVQVVIGQAQGGVGPVRVLEYGVELLEQVLHWVRMGGASAQQQLAGAGGACPASRVCQAVAAGCLQLRVQVRRQLLARKRLELVIVQLGEVDVAQTEVAHVDGGVRLDTSWGRRVGSQSVDATGLEHGRGGARRRGRGVVRDSLGREGVGNHRKKHALDKLAQPLQRRVLMKGHILQQMTVHRIRPDVI